MPAAREALLKEVGLLAGNCLKRYFGKELSVKKKGELDLVTIADEAAERVVVQEINKHYPDDGILAEEGSSQEGTSEFQWIVDPLDGTTNFAHRLPHFAVSIALSKNSEIVSGLVYDPIKEECFQAHKGEGATLNDCPIEVGNCLQLDEALVVTGFPYDRRKRLDELLARIARILTHCQGLRRSGSAALDLAYVACGRYDVFLEDGLHPWDMAAGQLLVSEAGGTVRGLDDSPVELARGDILATNETLRNCVLLRLARG